MEGIHIRHRHVRMAVAPLVWLACAVASGASAAAVSSAPRHAQPGDAPATKVVHTYRGSVKGFLLNGTWVFRGIPFAKPPVGDLRFAPPVPVDPWNGTLDATNFGNSCIQMGSPQVGGQWRGAAWTTLNITASSEDCLYLNVYVPQTWNPKVTEPLLPVLAYLHAGEFRFGTSNDQENNFPYNFGDAAILVTGNARLSLMGYAALDELRNRDTGRYGTPGGSTGNYGVQDQRMMMQWIQESIVNFGGDPDRVTIFGESSGGASVGFHVSSKSSKGYFTRAILESPGLTQSKTWDASESNTQYAISALTAAASPGCSWGPPGNKSEYRTFNGLVVSSGYHHFGPNPFELATVATMEAAITACDANPECFLISVMLNGTSVLYKSATPGSFSEGVPSMYNESRREPDGTPLPKTLMRLAPSSTRVACLVGADAADLISINMSPPYNDDFFTDAEAPTIDGVELVTDLQTVIRTSIPPGMELLAGCNLDEGTEFMSSTPPIKCNASEAEFLEWAQKLFGDALGAKVPGMYTSLQEPTPVCPYSSPGENVNNYMAAMRSAGDSAITCRTRDMLMTAARSGGKGYWYQFTVSPIMSLNMDNLPWMGAFHGAEVPFVFGYPAELSSDNERALSRAMGCYWANFASTGDPNSGPCSAGHPLPKWPEISSMEGGVAIQFRNTSIEVVNQLLQAQCDLFAQYP